MKTCTECNKEKPETEFYVQKHRNNRLFPKCKQCHKDISIANAKKHRKTDPERIAAQDRKYKLKRYGLTPEDYDRMLAEQGGVCAICGSSDPSDRWDSFHVDHCHSTGKVRGLLCSHCNHILGKANDDPSVLLAAIQYLSRNSRPPAV